MSAEDEALAKSGKELFKELLRYYPVGEYEDYLKNGVWKDDQMRIDLQLYLAHRNEGGAPEPIPLEEVKMPEIPDVKPTAAKIFGVGTVGVSIASPAGPLVTGARPALVATPVGLSGAAGDLREIALFVSKYKLDPSKAKTALAPLLQARRKYVLAKFTSEKTGAEANEELEKYIKECEASKEWDNALPAATAPGAVLGTAPAGMVGTAPANGGVSVTPKAVGVGAVAPKPGAITMVRPAGVTMVSPPGAKRPPGVVAPQMLDASKRPRVTVGQTAPAAVGPAAKLLGGMVRPPVAVGGRPVVAPPAGRGMVVQPGTVRPPNAWGNPRAVTPQKGGW